MNPSTKSKSLEICDKSILPKPNNFNTSKKVESETNFCLKSLNFRKLAYAFGFLLRLLIFLAAFFKPELVLIHFFELVPSPDNLKIIVFHAYHQAFPLFLAVTSMILDSEKSKVMNIMLIFNDLLSSWAIYKMNNSNYSLVTSIMTFIYIILILDNIFVYIYG